MSSPTESKSNDQLFCWEHVSRSGSVFRMSRAFAPGQQVQKLLPVYALFAVIEDVCSSISDEDVARSKIAWWRIECVQKNPAESHHPVLKEMKRTGALQMLSAELFNRLFDSAEYRLDAGAPADLGALKKVCIEIMRPQLEIELAACGIGQGALHFEPGMLAGSGQLQLIRESSGPKHRSGFWWVPLNLLARHGVSRGDIENRSESSGAGALFNELFEANGIGQSGAIPASEAAAYQPARHIFAINALYSRQLKRLQNRRPGQYQEELQKLKLTDLFAAWQSARQLRWR
jgi:phytoene synthase